MRLFIGIGLPPTLAESLARAASNLLFIRERIRWTPPENLHLTLSFLGQVAPDRLTAIEQALSGIRSPPLRLELDGVSAFPRAGILYAPIKPTPALLTLAEQVFLSTETCGYPREQRPYTPHITLARIKGSAKNSIHLRKQQSPVFHQRFEAHEIRLYESLTLPQGAQYKVLHKVPLIDRVGP